MSSTDGQAMQQQKDREASKTRQQLEALAEAMGVSNITELTDALTKMAPLDELRGTSDFIQRNGGIEKVTAAVNAASAVGGAEKVAALAGEVEAMTKRLVAFGTCANAFGAR